MDDFAPWRRYVIAKLKENRKVRVVGLAYDGLDAVLKASELKPDLILMDISLPKLNGIGAARRIRRLSPDSKILFLSQTFDLDVARAAFSVGGHGYVVKSDAEGELFTALEVVMLGKRFVSARLAGHDFADSMDEQFPNNACLDLANGAALPPAHGNATVGHGHAVQFYADDASFLERYTRFAGSALTAGDAVVVVATEPHRESLRQRLQSLGPDFGDAVRRGRYVALDPADTLASFMVNDLPDPGRFMKVTGDLLSASLKAAKGAQPRVAACGECAPLLYKQGRADGAIRLEQLWNEAAELYDVDVLCAYPLESFQGEESRPAYYRICAEHSAIYSV